MNNSNETTTIDINEESVIYLEKVQGAIVDIDYSVGKKIDAGILGSTISGASSEQKTVIIPDGQFLLSETVVLNDLDYVKIVNNGVLEADPAPLETDPDSLPISVFSFSNCEKVYYEGGTIRSDHASAKIVYAPEGHSRVKDVPSSMRTAISATCCEKVEIKNATFSGLEYGIHLLTPNNTSSDLCNGDVTISNITVTETGQPIFVSDTHNVTIENVTMTSRANMGGGDHFIYCSRFVDNVYIKGKNTLEYSDHNYGCAINLRNGHANTDSLKYCVIENVTVRNMYCSFVSAKADTKVVCNNCIINTTSDTSIVNSVINDTEYFVLVGENAEIHLNNCEFTDNLRIYGFASFKDNVKVMVTGGKYMNLKSLASLGETSSQEGNCILFNATNAEFETAKYENAELLTETGGKITFAHIFVGTNVLYDFSARFTKCKLKSTMPYFYQNKTERCKIYCNDCEFENTGDLEATKVFLAYLIEDTDSNPDTAPVAAPLLNNIRIINCKGKEISDVCRADFYGEAVMYGNEFTYTESTDTTTNS